MTAKNWFKIGQEGLQEKLSMDSANQIRASKNAPRFWLRVGEEAVIVFVDDTGFYAKTHQLNIAGSWNNFVTCTADFQPCPVCNSGDRPSLIGYYTVIDTREIQFKDGTRAKNRRVLFPAKNVAINMIADLKKKYNSLIGLAVKVKRYGQKSPNCGDYFEVISDKRIALKSLGADADVVYNYEKILAPPTPEELDTLGFGNRALGEVTADVDNTDDIPF
jgi:hypothetical protein